MAVISYGEYYRYFQILLPSFILTDLATLLFQVKFVVYEPQFQEEIKNKFNSDNTCYH
jgi:hypothetical protein